MEDGRAIDIFGDINKKKKMKLISNYLEACFALALNFLYCDAFIYVYSSFFVHKRDNNDRQEAVEWWTCKKKSSLDDLWIETKLNKNYDIPSIKNKLYYLQ